MKQIIILLIAGVCILFFIYTLVLQTHPTPSSADIKASYEVIGQLSEMITKEHVAQIKRGMTYEEIVSIIRHPGKEVSRQTIPSDALEAPGLWNKIKKLLHLKPYRASEQVEYEWVNRDGTYARLVFLEGELFRTSISGALGFVPNTE